MSSYYLRQLVHYDPSNTGGLHQSTLRRVKFTARKSATRQVVPIFDRELWILGRWYTFVQIQTPFAMLLLGAKGKDVIDVSAAC